MVHRPKSKIFALVMMYRLRSIRSLSWCIVCFPSFIHGASTKISYFCIVVMVHRLNLPNLCSDYGASTKRLLIFPTKKLFSDSTFATYIMFFGNLNSCMNPWLWFHFNRKQLKRACPCRKSSEPLIQSLVYVHVMTSEQSDF